ncbi:MAG: PQQ-dependent sugar dehydrogenase [Thermoleophilaceae bacterium]|nr:PQQ-dependent sugar dehydrogenase [Thermoleophilaceae bacterium]
MSHLSVARLILALLVLAGVLAPAAQAQYQVPADNPFVSTPGARGEIYVYGMRNPYRWSFDRQTGDMWIGDVGGSASGSDQEEITYLGAGRIRGANLGWNCFSGTAVEAGCTPTNYFPPVHTYPSGPDVVIGGYVVRDPDLPAFAGRYLFGRFNTGVYRLEANGTATGLGVSAPTLSGFGEDGTGHLYATTLSGPVYRLTQSGSALALTSIGNFNQPVAVAAAPGDTERLFIVERTGVIKVRTGGQVSDFLDITSLVKNGGEQGLLAVAVAPDYATSGRVFAYYTDNGNDLQLDEFRRTADGPDRADPTTRRPLLTIQHDAAMNHNGGQLLFGPDGLLYLSTGDGGTQGDPEGDAQSLASLLGKVLRLDVGVPPAAVDTVAPQLRTRVKSRQRVLRLRGAVVYARCSEACSIVAGGRLKVGTREYRLRRVGKAVDGVHRARVKVLLTTKTRRALKKALKRHRQPVVTVNLRARDATGNRSPLASKTVRVTR